MSGDCFEAFSKGNASFNDKLYLWAAKKKTVLYKVLKTETWIQFLEYLAFSTGNWVTVYSQYGVTECGHCFVNSHIEKQFELKDGRLI